MGKDALTVISSSEKLLRNILNIRTHTKRNHLLVLLFHNFLVLQSRLKPYSMLHPLLLERSFMQVSVEQVNS